MRRPTRYGLILAITLLQTAAVGAEDAVLKVGVAEVEITPPTNFPVCGYYHVRLATGTIDPLKARAMVFEQGNTRAALVVCDLTGISADLTAEVRKRAAERTGIAAEQIQLAATHSHTGPDYTRHLYHSLGKTLNPPDSAPYAETLIKGIVAAIETAAQTAQPVMIEAGSAIQQIPVSFNRRFVMKDGSVKTWQALANPQVVRAAGPIDPEIGLVRVKPLAQGSPLGILSNFALHLDTVGGTQWSADYPYFIEQAVRKSQGEKVVSLFGTGCCGDINHSDPSATVRNKTDFIGGSLGQTIVAALPQLTPIKTPTLRLGQTTVELPLREVTAADAQQAALQLSEVLAGKPMEFLAQVTAYRNVVLDHLQNKPPHVPAAEILSWGLSHHFEGIGPLLPVEVHVICIGEDLAIVTLPGEIFVDLGLAIKRGSPFKTTLVIELTNSQETHYIPTRAAYAGGSYEVTNSNLRPGSGEMLVEAALQLLRTAASEK